MWSVRNNRLKWLASILLIVLLVGLVVGPVAGEQTWVQSDMHSSETWRASVSELVQQNGTIAMEHVQVAIRASDLEAAPGERVTVSYDGVAFTSNPTSIRLQLIAVIPSGVSVSNMQAEGCNPQCPVTDNEIEPGDRLQPGSFTISATEEGEYPILIRVVYTLNNGNNQSWTQIRELSLSVQKDSSPTLVERTAVFLSSTHSNIRPVIIDYFPTIIFIPLSMFFIYNFNGIVSQKIAHSIHKGKFGADVIGFLLFVIIPINSYFVTLIVAAIAEFGDGGQSGGFLLGILCITGYTASVVAYTMGESLRWLESNIFVLILSLSYILLQIVAYGLSS